MRPWNFLPSTAQEPSLRVPRSFADWVLSSPVYSVSEILEQPNSSTLESCSWHSGEGQEAAKSLMPACVPSVSTSPISPSWSWCNKCNIGFILTGLSETRAMLPLLLQLHVWYFFLGISKEHFSPPSQAWFFCSVPSLWGHTHPARCASWTPATSLLLPQPISESLPTHFSFVP